MHHILDIPMTEHLLITLALEEMPLWDGAREGFRGDIAGQIKLTRMDFRRILMLPT